MPEGGGERPDGQAGEAFRDRGRTDERVGECRRQHHQIADGAGHVDVDVPTQRFRQPAEIVQDVIEAEKQRRVHPEENRPVVDPRREKAEHEGHQPR